MVATRHLPARVILVQDPRRQLQLRTPLLEVSDQHQNLVLNGIALGIYLTSRLRCVVTAGDLAALFDGEALRRRSKHWSPRPSRHALTIGTGPDNTPARKSASAALPQLLEVSVRALLFGYADHLFLDIPWLQDYPVKALVTARLLARWENRAQVELGRLCLVSVPTYGTHATGTDVLNVQVVGARRCIVCSKETRLSVVRLRIGGSGSSRPASTHVPDDGSRNSRS